MNFCIIILDLETLFQTQFLNHVQLKLRKIVMVNESSLIAKFLIQPDSFDSQSRQCTPKNRIQ